jgi:hypothetical protein
MTLGVGPEITASQLEMVMKVGSSNRGWESGSGCSIGRDHSVCRMRIGLVTLSSLEISKFSFPIFLKTSGAIR